MSIINSAEFGVPHDSPDSDVRHINNLSSRGLFERSEFRRRLFYMTTDESSDKALELDVLFLLYQDKRKSTLDICIRNFS